MTAPQEANMTTLQEAARDALEALERIGKDFVCRSAHHAKKDQHSAFAECPVVVRHTDAIESLRTALAQQVTLVPQEWTNLLAYALQDDMHNRLTPRVVDIAYTAFTLAKRPNAEDGGASDWFNDTKPKVTELIAKLRKDLIEEFAAASAPVAQQGEPEPKLWLWKNFVDGKQEYWVFDNLYPININDDDPQTLGDPCGYALFKPSRNGRKDTQ